MVTPSQIFCSILRRSERILALFLWRRHRVLVLVLDGFYSSFFVNWAFIENSIVLRKHLGQVK